jgi:hypothetical protein
MSTTRAHVHNSAPCKNAWDSIPTSSPTSPSMRTEMASRAVVFMEATRRQRPGWHRSAMSWCSCRRRHVSRTRGVDGVDNSPAVTAMASALLALAIFISKPSHWPGSPLQVYGEPSQPRAGLLFVGHGEFHRLRRACGRSSWAFGVSRTPPHRARARALVGQRFVQATPLSSIWVSLGSSGLTRSSRRG